MNYILTLANRRKQSERLASLVLMKKHSGNLHCFVVESRYKACNNYTLILKRYLSGQSWRKHKAGSVADTAGHTPWPQPRLHKSTRRQFALIKQSREIPRRATEGSDDGGGLTCSWQGAVWCRLRSTWNSLLSGRRGCQAYDAYLLTAATPWSLVPLSVQLEEIECVFPSDEWVEAHVNANGG